MKKYSILLVALLLIPNISICKPVDQPATTGLTLLQHKKINKNNLQLVYKDIRRQLYEDPVTEQDLDLIINFLEKALENHEKEVFLQAFGIIDLIQKKQIVRTKEQNNLLHKLVQNFSNEHRDIFDFTKTIKPLLEAFAPQVIEKIPEKEPVLELWKTIDGAAQIAQGLQESLQKNIGKELSDDEIETLIRQSQENDKIATTLIQRTTIPADAQLYLFGDLHGDFGPLDALLKKLTKEQSFNQKTWELDKKVYIGGLGDYIDRGPDSVKNLYHLWKLKEANPEQVFLIRGNHETIEISAKYGFARDLYLLKLTKKNPEKLPSVFNQFIKTFALLPIVIFIDRAGTQNSRIALVHGGIAPGSTTPLIDEKHKFKTLRDSTQNKALMYLWSDLVDNDINAQKDFFNSSRNEGIVLSKTSVQDWMNTNNVKTIFHGHDQKKREFIENSKKYELFTQGKWRGLGSRWNDSAIVLNVAPNTQYYNTRTKGRYYDDYGVIACIEPKPANFVAQTTTDKTHAENGFAQEITTLDGYILKPIYFDPFTHEIVENILAQHSQGENPNNPAQ